MYDANSKLDSRAQTAVQIPSVGSNSIPQIFQALESTASQLIVLSDAQLSIWKMKLVRAVAAAFLAIPAAVALLCLGAYGFILLDRAAGIAMDIPQNPPWVSPVVRGTVYLLFSIFAVWSCWNRALASSVSPVTPE